MDWLDLARYADTYGYQADVERDMSPYRDWVIRAFNQNLPYDQFLLWQLAGDLLPNATRDQRIATAFNRLHRQTNEGGSIEEEFRTEYVVDRVNTFGTAMLGLTLECARCHDHKFDPITQRDYYSLFAFFNSIDESGLYSHFTNATPSPSLLLWPGSAEKQHELLQRAHRRGRSPADGDRPRRARAIRRLARALRQARADGCSQPTRADRPPRVRRGERRRDAGPRVEDRRQGSGRAVARARPPGVERIRTPRSSSAATAPSSIPASGRSSAPTRSRSAFG